MRYNSFDSSDCDTVPARGFTQALAASFHYIDQLRLQDFILQVCCLATLDSSVGSPKTSLSSKVMNEDDGSEAPVPSGMLLKPSPARTSTENEPTLVVTPSPRTDRALSVDLLAPTPPTSVPEPMTSAPTDSQDHHPEEEPEEEVEEPEEVPNPKHL